ncbi:MAG: hypothetical protein ACFFFG_14080 [Candidatus Thorarchaeota archaeon]
MTTYTSLLTGIHPLSEFLIKQIFDLKYGRVSSPDLVQKAFKQDILDLISIMKQIYPQAVSTGNLGWWDIYRPFTEAILRQTNGEKTGNLPVARMPLTNTFYRQPIVNSKLNLDTPILKTAKHPFLEGNILQMGLLPESFRGKAWSVCLPGPYTFSRAAAIDPENYPPYKSRNELMDDFTEVLEEEIKFLSAEGFSHVILNEGGIAWETPDKDITTTVEENWNRISNDVPLQVAIHTHHSLKSYMLELLANSKVWGVGIDCVRNDMASLKEYDFEGKALIAGVVDAQSYYRNPSGDLVVEEAEDLVIFGEKLSDITADQIILAPTSRLEFIPRSVADLKIQILGHAIKSLADQE